MYELSVKMWIVSAANKGKHLLRQIVGTVLFKLSLLTWEHGVGRVQGGRRGGMVCGAWEGMLLGVIVSTRRDFRCTAHYEPSNWFVNVTYASSMFQMFPAAKHPLQLCQPQQSK